VFLAKENELRDTVGLDPLARRPLLYYAYDPGVFSDDLYKSVGAVLDGAGDRFSWIDQHPFLFSLCLVRRFFEQSNGVKYNLFANGLRINNLLEGALGGVFKNFDSDCDRRYNFHKVLAESFFFFGAQTSQYYGVLSRVRQEFERADSVEDAYRSILNDESTLPFAYNYLLQAEDELFRELLCGEHQENRALQNAVNSKLSRVLRDSSANTGWAINWSSKKLDVLVERLVLADNHISNLTVTCAGETQRYPLGQFRYENIANKRCFPTIRISELFDDLSLRSGCKVSLGHAYQETVKELFKSELPLVFQKVGDIARLPVLNEDGSVKKDDVIHASELILLKDGEPIQGVKLGDECLSLDRKSISLGGHRFSAVLIAVNRRFGEGAKPLIVDDVQICRAGIRPHFEVIDQKLRIQSSEGDLFYAEENVELQLNSQEILAPEKLKVAGLDYPVAGTRVLLEGFPEGIMAPVAYNKIKTRVLRLSKEYGQVESAPMQAIHEFWKPDSREWATPGKTTGALLFGDQKYEAWVPWELAQFAWKNLGVGFDWKYGSVQTFSSLGELEKNCVELWVPSRGKLKLGDVELCQFEEGLNSIRFDSPEMSQTLRSCLQNVETIGGVDNLCCCLSDGNCLDVAKVSLEPTLPVLIRTQTAEFSVYVPCEADVGSWNVCVLDESRIAQPVRWLNLVSGRNDFNVEMNGQCCWAVLCQGTDWKTEWIDFLVQAAGRTPAELLAFIPAQRAPLSDRLGNLEEAGEQLGLVKSLLSQFDGRIFRETLVDTLSEDSGIHISRVSRNVAQQMFHENLSLETIEQKVDQLLQAGFNVFSVRSRYMDWIEGICKWTQIQKGTAAQLWQKCAWFPSMELFRNRFPLFGKGSDAWKRFYSGRNNCNQQNLKRELGEYFPSGKIHLSLSSDEQVLEVCGVEEFPRDIRVQIKKNGTRWPVFFGVWQKTIQRPMAEIGFSLHDVDVEDIYPLMSEDPCSVDDYKKNRKAKMYLSKKMYRCAYYEACVAVDQLVFLKENLDHFYEILIRELNPSIVRDQILLSVLTRCHEKYQSDTGYANRLAVLVLATFSRRRCHFSDRDHQMFMDGMLRAYRTCHRLLMNDLMAVEFFRVWFSRG